MRWMVLVLVLVCGGAEAQEKEIPPFAAVIPGTSGGLMLVDFMDPAPTPKFGKPKEGNKLIAVQLIFATGPEVKKSVRVAPMFAEIKCADMAIRGAAMAGAPDPALATAEMKDPEDKLMGWVAFEIPAELKAEECKLNYGMMEKSSWIKLSAAAARQPDPPK